MALFPSLEECVAMRKDRMHLSAAISNAVRNPCHKEQREMFPRSLTFVRDDNLPRPLLRSILNSKYTRFSPPLTGGDQGEGEA